MKNNLLRCKRSTSDIVCISKHIQNHMWPDSLLFEAAPATPRTNLRRVRAISLLF
jgi:hypothetical protein